MEALILNSWPKAIYDKKRRYQSCELQPAGKEKQKEPPKPKPKTPNSLMRGRMGGFSYGKPCRCQNSNKYRPLSHGHHPSSVEPIRVFLRRLNVTHNAVSWF